MDDCARGYRIGDKLYPWGTAFEEPAERPCTSAYGFETIFVELFAADTGRPVTTASYELAAVAPRTVLFAELVKRLGQPDEIDRSGEEAGRDSSSNVVLYAVWPRANHSISVSFWGAPRPSAFGDGVGRLYLTWSDTAAAARPFLAEWRAASDAVARAAAAPDERPAIFTVAWPIFDVDYPDSGPDIRAVNTPGLLATPKEVADRLGSRSFALWRGGGAWHLSHGRATVVLGSGPVQILDIAPARGGGYSSIGIGPWSVRDVYRSPALQEAVDALARVPGLAIERHEGHNA